MTATDPTLTAYVDVLEEAVKQAFVAEKLPAHLHRVVQGPHTLTVVTSLRDPNARHISQVMKMSAAIEARAHVSPVRIHNSAGYFFIEIPARQPAVVYGERLTGRKLAVPLGVSPYDPRTFRPEIVGIDFERIPHFVLAGPTNCGKTTTLLEMAYHLAKQNRPHEVRFVIIARKPEQWLPLKDLPHTWKIIVNADEAVAALRWLCALQDARIARGTKLPHVFLLADDVVNLLMVADVKDQLANLASMGRGASIHLVLGTQRITEAGTGGKMVTSNILNRIVYHVADAADAALYAGRKGTGAEKLTGFSGDAMLVQEANLQRVALAYMDARPFAALNTSGYTSPEYAPWLGGTTPALVPQGENGAFSAENGLPAPVPVVPAVPPLPPKRKIPHGDLRDDDAEHVRQVWAATGQQVNATLDYIGWGKGSRTLGRLHAAVR